MLAPGPIEKDGKRSKGLTYQTSAEYICIVTALGHDIHDVVEQVYETVKRIQYPDPIVRNDIGKQLEKEIPKLKALGYNEVPDW
jgi:phosphoribosylamine-glycine ligase